MSVVVRLLVCLSPFSSARCVHPPHMHTQPSAHVCTRFTMTSAGSSAARWL